MLSATVLAIFWVPLFYVMVSSISKDKRPKAASEEVDQ
jgi:multidrug efflux pump